MRDELMQLEDRLARGRGAEYREILAEDALVVVPGAVLTKSECAAAMDESPGWDEVHLDDARLITDAATASVVYEFRGRRGESEYSATLSSTYRLPGRKLVLHQQTPH